MNPHLWAVIALSCAAFGLSLAAFSFVLATR